MDPFSGSEKMEKTVSHNVVLPCTVIHSAQHLDKPTGSPSHLTIFTRPITRCSVEQFSINGEEPKLRQKEHFILRVIYGPELGVAKLQCVQPGGSQAPVRGLWQRL